MRIDCMTTTKSNVDDGIILFAIIKILYMLYLIIIWVGATNIIVGDFGVAMLHVVIDQLFAFNYC